VVSVWCGFLEKTNTVWGFSFQHRKSTKMSITHQMQLSTSCQWVSSFLTAQSYLKQVMNALHNWHFNVFHLHCEFAALYNNISPTPQCSVQQQAKFSASKLTADCISIYQFNPFIHPSLNYDCRLVC